MWVVQLLGCEAAVCEVEQGDDLKLIQDEFFREHRRLQSCACASSQLPWDRPEGMRVSRLLHDPEVLGHTPSHTLPKTVHRLWASIQPITHYEVAPLMSVW